MSYRIIWRKSAEEQLTSIWLSARDRISISEAIDALDLELRRHPLEIGESRAGNNRIVFAGPLVLDIEVDPLRRIVSVDQVLKMR